MAIIVVVGGGTHDVIVIAGESGFGYPGSNPEQGWV